VASKSFKVSFSLDEHDVRYFKSLFRKAKKAAAGEDPEHVLNGARELVESVRSSPKTPSFVTEAASSIEDLVQIIEDEDWKAPKSVRHQVLAALAYFSNPDDLIPDHIPVLGFLDDAIMIKFVEDEFKHELRGYRKFRKFRDGAEVRPWTRVANDRLPSRLEAQRTKLRADIDKRKKADAGRGGPGF